MPNLVLDTTVLIDALRGRPAADRIRAHLTNGTTLMTTAINVEEIFRGLRPNEIPAADKLFTGLAVLPIRREEAERAGLATGNPKDFPMVTAEEWPVGR